MEFNAVLRTNVNSSLCCSVFSGCDICGQRSAGCHSAIGRRHTTVQVCQYTVDNLHFQTP